MPSSNVLSVIQDHRGYLWIGTSSGLSKFNGYEFSNYSVEHGLSNEYIKVVFEDSEKQIWIGSNAGLDLLKPELNKRGEISNILQGSIISSIAEFNGEVVVGSNQGLHIIDKKGAVVTKELGRVRTIAAHGGKLFIGTPDGLLVGSSTKGKFEKQEIPNVKDQPFVRSILFDDEAMFIGTAAGLIKSDKDMDKVLTYAHPRISDLIIDSKNRIWLCHENGISRVDNEGIREKEIFDNSIVNCHSAIEDQEGNVWMATETGLYRYSEYPFSRIAIDSRAEEVYVNAICQTSDSIIWLGTSEGKIEIHKSTGEVEYFVEIEEFSRGSPIQCIYKDSNGRIWISVLIRGLFIYENAVLKPYNDPRRILSPFIFDIEEDREGNIWFGGPRGLGKLNSDRFEYIEVESKSPFVNAIQKDNESNIILSLNSGLVKINNGSLEKMEDIFLENCSGISLTASNMLWIATKDKGLFKTEFHEGKWKSLEPIHISEREGAQQIKAISQDSSGNIWIGTDIGVFRLGMDGNTQHFRLKNDPMRSQCAANSILSSSGKVLIGSGAGVFVFRTAGFTSPKAESIPSYITSMEIINEGYDSVDLKYSGLSYNIPENLILPYDANFINFSFEAVSFSNLENLEYAYMLEGLEKDFSQSSVQREITYTNLEPGSYTFLLKAREAEKEWSDKIASFSFTIKAPFWEKWWFRIGSLVAFGALVFLFVNYRIKRIRREENEKVELNKKNYGIQADGSKDANEPSFYL